MDAVPPMTTICVDTRRVSAPHAMPRPTEPAQLLDVEMDQLTRAATLVSVGWLGRLEARQPMQPEPLEDRTHGRDRHPELRRDPRGRQPQPAELLDQRLDRSRSATRNALRCRRTINQL